MKKDTLKDKLRRLKAFMAEYDDDDKDPRSYLLDMIRDYGVLEAEHHRLFNDAFKQDDYELTRLRRNELFEKIAQFVWILFVDEIKGPLSKIGKDGLTEERRRKLLIKG